MSKAPVLEDGSTYTAGEPFELKAPSDAAASASNTVRSLGLEWDNEREDAMVMFETVSADEKKIIRQHHSRAESAGRHECRRGRGVGNSPRSGRQVRRRPGGRAERPCHIGVMLCKAGGTGGGSTSGGGSLGTCSRLLLPLLGPTLRRLLLPSRILRRMSITGFPKRQRRRIYRNF